MDASVRLSLTVATSQSRSKVEREVIQKCRESFNQRKNQQSGG